MNFQYRDLCVCDLHDYVTSKLWIKTIIISDKIYDMCSYKN